MFTAIFNYIIIIEGLNLQTYFIRFDNHYLFFERICAAAERKNGGLQ